ncbi:MAG: AEC family transporter [Candidatus Heteroscillospira sp.]
MDNFIFSVNTALPLLLMILAGMLLKRVGLLDTGMVSALDSFSFRIAMPLLLFYDISTMDFYSEFSLSFMLFCFIVSVVSFLVMWKVSLLVFPDRRAAGSFAQGSVRGSVAMLGVMIVTNIYGSAGIAALMVAASVPVYNVMSVLILTFCGSGRENSAGQLKAALKGILTNPFILGIAAGLPFALLRINLPTALASAAKSLGSTATPLALVVIGASFSYAEATARLKPALAATAIKLLVLPAVGLPLAVMLGFREAALTSIILMLGSATAPASFIMAKNMGCDAPLSANIVMLTDVFYSVTLTFWLFLLKTLALI